MWRNCILLQRYGQFQVKDTNKFVAFSVTLLVVVYLLLITWWKFSLYIAAQWPSKKTLVVEKTVETTLLSANAPKVISPQKSMDCFFLEGKHQEFILRKKGKRLFLKRKPQNIRISLLYFWNLKFPYSFNMNSRGFVVNWIWFKKLQFFSFLVSFKRFFDCDVNTGRYWEENCPKHCQRCNGKKIVRLDCKYELRWINDSEKSTAKTFYYYFMINEMSKSKNLWWKSQWKKTKLATLHQI